MLESRTMRDLTLGRLRIDAVVETAARALIRWVCRLDTRRGPAAWRGLDILHFDDGLVSRKLTYAKAKVPRLGETPRDGGKA